VALASASTLSGALEAILGAVLSVEGIDCGGVYLVEDGDLVLKIHRHLSPDFVERTERFGPDDPRTRLVMASTPIFRRWTDLLLPADPIVDGEGLRATAVIPVVHDGKVVGSLNAASHDEDEIQDPARDALQAITSQIGIVTSRLRAEDELRERERFLALLSEITRRTLEAGLPIVVEEIRSSFAISPRLTHLLPGWSALGLPLFARGQRLGAIVLAWDAPHRSTAREAAARVRASLRTVDVLALANGEVFYVLLAENAPKQPARVAERLRSVVAERPFAAKDGELSLSASAGVSGLSEKIRDFPALLSGAETALAAARAAGGNRTVVHG
jgi:GAF domain/Diguanylate cyclase, GGDEF domain